MLRAPHIRQAILLLPALALSVGACGADYMAKSDDQRKLGLLQATVTEDGGISGALTANSKTTQILQADTTGALKGAAMVFPPGSLAIDVSVTIREGSSLADSSNAASLGISDSGLAAAGPAVVMLASQDLEAARPFTVALPITSGGGLALADTTIAVLYKVIALVDGERQFILGIKPLSQLEVEGNIVKMTTTRFGSFQVVRTTVPVTVEKSVQSYEPVIPKKSSNPLVGAWATACKTENGRDEGGKDGSNQQQQTGGGQTSAPEGSNTGTNTSTNTGTNTGGNASTNGGDGSSPTSTATNSNTSTSGRQTFYRTSEVIFSDTTFSYVDAMYADAGCTGAVLRKEGASGTISIGADWSPVPGSKAIDIIFAKTIVTLVDAAMVAEANASKRCGFSNWTSGVTKDTTGQPCGNERDNAGSTMYQIFKVDGDSLRLGSDYVEGEEKYGTTAATRPVALESEADAMKRRN